MIIWLPYILFLLLFFTFLKKIIRLVKNKNLYEGSKKKRTAVKEEGEGSTTPKGKGPASTGEPPEGGPTLFFVSLAGPSPQSLLSSPPPPSPPPLPSSLFSPSSSSSTCSNGASSVFPFKADELGVSTRQRRLVLLSFCSCPVRL